MRSDFYADDFFSPLCVRLAFEMSDLKTAERLGDSFCD